MFVEFRPFDRITISNFVPSNNQKGGVIWEKAKPVKGKTDL